MKAYYELDDNICENYDGYSDSYKNYRIDDYTLSRMVVDRVCKFNTCENDVLDRNLTLGKLHIEVKGYMRNINIDKIL